MTLAGCLEGFLNQGSCLCSQSWRLQFNKLGAAGTNLETIVHTSKPCLFPGVFGLGCERKWNLH